MRSFLVMTRIVILSMLILFAWIGPSDAGMSRGGFGRFGRLNDDGLLTLNVSPSGFTTVPPMRPLEIRFADEGVRARVSRISATEKVILLLDGGEGSPKSVRYTLLYPGFSAVFGREAVLRISGVRMQVEVSAPDPATGFFWLLLRADEGRCVPLVVAFREGFQPLNWTLKQEGEVGRFEIGGDQELGEVRFITPLGMREFASNSPPKQYELLKTAAAAWAARGIPQLRSRMYRLDPDGQLVSILEAFQSSQGEAIAPLPPVLAFAMGEGYPAEVRGSAVRTDCLTKYGLYVFVEGNRLEYTLPVPPTEERGYIRCQGSPERVQALNSLVGHLAGESATSAADLAYAGVANAQMAWAYLDKERRDQITSAWQEHLSLAFQLPPYIPGQFRDSWREEREPITGAQYYWTSAVSSAPQMDDRSEINLGTALPLYGLYKYGQYSGDWGLVESQWRAAQRIFRYVELADDWAWMTAASGDMGFGTGGGDCMAADYCGRVACLKIARVLGDRSGKEYFAYWAARAAVPTVARFWYTDWARRQGFVPENAVVQGFLEHKTFDASRLDEAGEDPWRNARLLSGNGVFPELFGLYTRDARSALEDFTRQFSLHYPDWADGLHVYPFPTEHGGNSVYVAFPQIYARAVLGEPTNRLWDYVDSAMSKRGNDFWIGPNVLAELLARETPLILTEWQPATYRDGYVTEDGRSVVLEFDLRAVAEWTLTASVNPPFLPERVTINGEETQFAFEKGVLKVSKEVEGKVEVKVDF